MVLIDTSVWVDFLRRGNDTLETLLEDGEVVTHSLVIGELHVGNIRKRHEFLSLLEELPKLDDCPHKEVLYLINHRKLYGVGIGYSDAHLLCASLLHEVPLWTLDLKLARQAKRLSK